MTCPCNNQNCPWIKNGEFLSQCENWKIKVCETRLYKIMALSGLDVSLPTGNIKFDDDKRKFPDRLTEGKYNVIIDRFIIDGEKHFIFISSNPGTGKSQILQWLFLETLKNGKSAWYTTAQALKDELFRLAVNQIFHSEIVDGIKKSWLIIIEDVGMEKQTEAVYFEEYLKSLLDCTGKKIIFSSNHSLTHLQEQYERVPQLVSRLDYARGAHGDIVWWQGEDKRSR